MAHAANIGIVRDYLREHGYDAFVAFNNDPHFESDLPDHWRFIKWLTGFTGSSATLVIANDFAGLWTDSRYSLQAVREVEGTGISVMGQESAGSNSYISWLTTNLPDDGSIITDGRLVSVARYRKIKDALKPGGIRITLSDSLTDDIWTERPLMSSSVAFEHPIKYSGMATDEKLKLVREKMTEAGLTHHLLCSPDDIMWLLNIRGADYPSSPLLAAFAVITPGQVILFADEEKIPGGIADGFDKAGIVILPYDEITGIVNKLTVNPKILLDPESTSAIIFQSLPKHAKVIEGLTIPSRLKAVKSKVELQNISEVMIKDGVALLKFFHWIETNLGVVPMSEISLAVKLHELRSHLPGYICDSFRPIIAFNEHAALPHYSAVNDTDAMIEENGILLVDSGAHYLGGTTDITRTICTGVPTLQQKKDFTLILKGHIGLAEAVFPYGTSGYQLDVLARKDLWANGLNYGHGTGHGVGYCLKVHEGPQSISPAGNKTPFEPGMITSNEPALYREGQYGIRTENLMVCFSYEENTFGSFLRFETLSLCYIDNRLIDKSLLTDTEIKWLNSYHLTVYTKLSPYLDNPEKLWLQEKTCEI